MKRILSILFLVSLFFCFSTAYAVDLTYEFDDDSHISGVAVVQGYTINIDAAIEQAVPEAGLIHYSSHDIDLSIWNKVIGEFFPENAQDLNTRLMEYGANVGTMISYDHAPIPVVLPYSECAPDAYLFSLQDKCSQFLTELGIPHDLIPFSIAYTAPRSGASHYLFMDASNRDKATGADICFLLSCNETPIIAGVEIGRYRGSLAYANSELLSQYPTAQFCFDMEGNLLDFRVANLIMSTSGIRSDGFLSWEEALQSMLEEYVSNDIIKRNLSEFSYTVTSIRCAWDMNFSDTGRLGWMISISGKSQNEASSTGWINRHTTCFVYGGQ